TKHRHLLLSPHLPTYHVLGPPLPLLYSLFHSHSLPFTFTLSFSLSHAHTHTFCAAQGSRRPGKPGTETPKERYRRRRLLSPSGPSHSRGPAWWPRSCAGPPQRESPTPPLSRTMPRC